MSAATPSEGTPLPPESARELERVCDRFEAAWHGGDEPRVEDYLTELPPALRPALLRELILLDIDYRHARGLSPPAAVYHERFPELSEDWLASVLSVPPTATVNDVSDSTDIPSWADPLHELGPASTGVLASETPSSWIGPYKLLQKLGEGGMGTVYAAEQEHPVARRVALKIIKAGMDSAQVVARFEQERQALALMDHPNIAKVFDAGTTDGGRPYFVMELVKGIPITRFCDQEHLTPRERLDLFIPVCQAVQHAHQKAIIHRDLKPSNVLIGLYDGRPVPKVIDFGVAKATGGKLTERTMFTEVGQIIGTLEYMAPEQAELNNLDIDTRADIYSLGVLLYEHLTGSPPFTGNQLRSAAFTEMLRMIREVEPVKPSTRVNTADNLPSLAALRKLEPRKLAMLIRGDLDWIVMRCLEKDRARRYETASGLALEIQRHLADEPVLAGPPSAVYKMGKFVKRNRGPVLAGMLVLAVLVAGVVGTTLGLIRADRALAAEAEQRGIAEANEREANAQKQRAIEFRDKALNALRATTNQDVVKLIGGKKELGTNERAYLEAIAKRWQEFAAQEGSDEQAQALRGEGHYQVANLWNSLDRRDEARLEYEHARDTRRKLTAQFPDVSDYQIDLARTHINLGFALVRTGKRDEAQREWEQALDVLQKSAAQFPLVREYRRLLAGTHQNLGLLFAELGKRDEARREYEQALRIAQNLATQYPTVPGYQRIVAGTHDNLGMLLSDLDRRDEARGEYERALDIRQKLAAQFPQEEDYQQELSYSHNNLGNLLIALGKWDDARREHQRALDIKQKLAAQFPALPGYQIDLGVTYHSFGSLHLAEDKPAESLPWFTKSITTLTAVHEQEPHDVRPEQYLCNSYKDRAIALNRLQRFAEAVKDWDMAIKLSSGPEQAGVHAARAGSRIHAGHVLEGVGEITELIQAGGWNARQWYDFACVYAVASGKSADKKQQYADRAMELLRKSVQAGYKNGAHMATDTDLVPLRNRGDFKKLLTELEPGKDKKEKK